MHPEHWKSIDISGAFLKGFNFEQIREALRQMGIDSPHRTVIIIPPLNVFRHLAELSDKFHIPEHQIHDYALLAIKPIYGLKRCTFGMATLSPQPHQGQRWTKVTSG